MSLKIGHKGDELSAEVRRKERSSIILIMILGEVIITSVFLDNIILAIKTKDQNMGPLKGTEPNP